MTKRELYEKGRRMARLAYVHQDKDVTDFEFFCVGWWSWCQEEYHWENHERYMEFDRLKSFTAEIPF